jgi:hypothetical protein
MIFAYYSLTHWGDRFFALIKRDRDKSVIHNDFYSQLLESLYQLLGRQDDVHH